MNIMANRHKNVVCETLNGGFPFASALGGSSSNFELLQIQNKWTMDRGVCRVQVGSFGEVPSKRLRVPTCGPTLRIWMSPKSWATQEVQGRLSQSASEWQVPFGRRPQLGDEHFPARERAKSSA
jgi:hypothetical protein